MSDVRRAVAAITGRGAGGGAGLADAAAVFAEACRQANDRLAACAQLLDAGQRDEALRRGQIEPDLLSLYADLDLPARDGWDDYCLDKVLPAAARLNAVAAQRLNQAYAETEPVKELLVRHRLLALARAPLGERLPIMRLLARAEPGNAGWADDVAEYEAARCDEMRAQAAQAARAADFDLADRLLAELTEPGWAAPPPFDLTERVREARAGALREAAARRLAPQRVAFDLAQAQDDLAAARAADHAVRNVQGKYGLADDDALVEPFADARLWLRREEVARAGDRDYRAALRELRTALDEGLAWYYVSEYYRQAVMFHRALPKDLRAAFHRRRRVEWGLRAGVASLVLLAVVGAGVGLWLVVGSR